MVNVFLHGVFRTCVVLSTQGYEAMEYKKGPEDREDFEQEYLRETEFHELMIIVFECVL